MTKVAIVIVNYNLRQVILDCLASVSKLNHGNLQTEIIVVDNASKDGSAEAIRAAYPWVTYIQNHDNLGFSGGNNTGMKYAVEHGFDFVLILNPDVVVDPNLVVELRKGFNQDDVGITAPKTYFAKGYEFHKDRYKADELGKVIWFAGGVMDWDNIIGHHLGVDEVDCGQFDDVAEIEYASGNCMMIKMEVIKKVGFLDDRYFMYYEDADLCMRAKKAGYKILFMPKAVLWHLNAQASGGSGNPLQNYFTTRNRLLFGFTYASFRTKFALLRESLRFIFSYKTRRMGVLDFYLMRFGKGSYIK